MFTERELIILEELINEEILSCCRSGHDIDGEHITTLRNILSQLGLNEIYKFDKWREE